MVVLKVGVAVVVAVAVAVAGVSLFVVSYLAIAVGL